MHELFYFRELHSRKVGLELWFFDIHNRVDSAILNEHCCSELP